MQSGRLGWNPARTDQILVKPDTGITQVPGFRRFRLGAVDKDNKVIGLMWGAYLTPALRCWTWNRLPINAVKSALSITIPEGSLNTTGPALRVTERSSSDASSRTSELISLLQTRLARTEQGGRC